MKHNLRFWAKIVWAICVTVFTVVFIYENWYASQLDFTRRIIVSFGALVGAIIGITAAKLFSNNTSQKSKIIPKPKFVICPNSAIRLIFSLICPNY